MKKGDRVHVKKLARMGYPFRYKDEEQKVVDLYASQGTEIIAPDYAYKNETTKCMLIFPYEMNGILLGKTRKAIGQLHPFEPASSGYAGYEPPEPAELSVKKWITVWVIEPASRGDQYCQPVYALEKDIE